MNLIRRFGVLAAIALGTGAAAAQGFPIQPITIVVPFPAGGIADSSVRLIAAKVAESTGQQVLVDNRGGAGGQIGASAVKSAKPDGYTLFLVNIGTHAINGEMFKSGTGIDASHVPYRGSAQVMQDLVSGCVDFFFDGVGIVPFAKEGKVRALAVADSKRMPQLPDVPTLAEAGLPNIDMSAWFGLGVPAGTPKPVIAKLHQEFVKTGKDAEVVRKLGEIGIRIVTSRPDEFAAFMTAETERVDGHPLRAPRRNGQRQSTFDAKAAAESAEVVAFVSKLPFAGFVDGSDKGNTKAKAEIWSEADKFRAGASKMQDEASKLNAAAKGGNLDQIKAAFGETAKTCKGCHDTYRAQ